MLDRSEKTFSFSFLLILDEGGLREGWVKFAYSSLAAAAGPHNHNKQQHQATHAEQSVPGHPCRLAANSKWFPIAEAAEFF
jgi:hypothetical protein